MVRLSTLLTCILFITSVGSSQAAPLDSPDTVYIDGVPCNRACQSYMAWSRQVSKTWNSQPGRSQFAQPSSKTKIQRATKTRENVPTRAAQSRVAKKVAPKRIEALPTNAAEPQLVNREDTKSTLADKTDSSPAPNPASGSEAGTTPEQVATAPPTEDLTTATAGPSQDKKPDGNTEPSSPSAAVFPAENETTALARPNNADQLVAILLVRPEIKSVADLANKVIAIDASRFDSVAGVRSAIVAAGAAEVQMSEGETLAMVRVMDGEVPAAVVTLSSPEAAEAWNAGVPGFNVLWIPLMLPSEKPGRG
jgi:hypothetical protein